MVRAVLVQAGLEGTGEFLLISQGVIAFQQVASS
jgi:hypothetical protein